ncbi:hypothetical protein XACLE20_1740005 [Xanthomonas citri pv. citri]|uniref:Uncharacterized protein n=1 Tax=Xanthomonas citri pv. citri TaxID=611301 RepID=A0A0U5F8X0_XANCI|nr:hypothetical protein XAC2911_960002 [Xanthomonas citri pv. citri]CEE78910.1 hypothetical protein XACLE20_1740005 [Xanthomonas citri pv. citri]CEG14921.1 hypothetical protein XAC3562_1550002 [Xanthomonas citri pv. citri]CEH50561.1 hypothetical protein XACLD7_14670002 [Xanthomonas citri pv. citri]CEH82648.1 hypothetical protein XAC3612_2770005 [Xanthomonas citri pv. citri]
MGRTDRFRWSHGLVRGLRHWGHALRRRELGSGFDGREVLGELHQEVRCGQLERHLDLVLGFSGRIAELPSLLLLHLRLPLLLLRRLGSLVFGGRPSHLAQRRGQEIRGHRGHVGVSHGPAAGQPGLLPIFGGLHVGSPAFEQVCVALDECARGRTLLRRGVAVAGLKGPACHFEHLFNHLF